MQAIVNWDRQALQFSINKDKVNMAAKLPFGKPRPELPHSTLASEDKGTFHTEYKGSSYLYS
jgi:hypothetical protein